MNTEMQVFQFETSSIRTVELEGVVWFVAGELSDILGYSRTADSLRLVDDDDKLLITNKNAHSAFSGFDIPDRGMYLVNESGMYSMVLNSRREESKRFKKWVTSEVLPSIRKTGQYQIPVQQPLQLTQHDLATRQLKNELEVWSLFECPLHIAQQEIVKLVRKDTGVDFSTALKYAKAQQNILPEEVMLEPTEMSRKLGFKSPNALNRYLQNLGMQINVRGEWIATAAGAKISQQHAWTKFGKTGYNLKWNLKAVKELLNYDVSFDL